MIDAAWEVASEVPADAELLAAFVWQGALDTMPVPAHLATLYGFSAAAGELLRASDGERAVVVVGLGVRSDSETGGTDARTITRAAGELGRAVRHAPTVAVQLADVRHTEAVVRGLVLGAYRFDRHRSEVGEPTLGRVVLVGGDAEALERALVVARAVVATRDLANETPQRMHVGVLVAEAEAVAAEAGLECRVLGRDELVAGGFGCLLAVNAGSVEPPALVELRYTPVHDDGRTPHVALVGKGITFDSGGLSLKPPTGMTTMKSDMSGAAAVLAVMAALAPLGVEVPVRGYLALTDNMPGPTATRPGEIVRARNGTTVEILDTDAEGRLVLADAIAYAAEAEPVAIIDIATLTGYARTIGRDYTVVHSDTPVLRDAVLDAAAAVGELAWAAPFARHMRGHLDSGIADLRNIGEPDEGDPVLAAQFLSSFSDGVPWCHLDIGETGWSGSTSGELVKGATGAMVRTLCEHLAGL